MTTKTPCYCSSLSKSVYADKDSPKPKCDFCAGIRKAETAPAIHLVRND